MKAFLLAAGKGTRLRPLTDKMPKCLVPICGKPLLLIWIELLERCGIGEILINTHHFAGQVEDFIDAVSVHTKLKITLVHEKKLLGSGGTVSVNRDFVKGEKDFVIAYADNLTNLNIREMIACHMKYKLQGCDLTMGLFRVSNPSACGIAAIDAQGKITSFIEKPENPPDNLANAGIYIASNKIFNFFPEPGEYHEKDVLDFGHHIFPRMTDRMYGYEIKKYLRDIGTMEAYDKAGREWPEQIV